MGDTANKIHTLGQPVYTVGTASGRLRRQHISSDVVRMNGDTEYTLSEVIVIRLRGRTLPWQHGRRCTRGHHVGLASSYMVSSDEMVRILKAKSVNRLVIRVGEGLLWIHRRPGFQRSRLRLEKRLSKHKVKAGG